MQRICFTMQVAADHRETYVRMHAEPWPELLVQLERTGWSNYSLFLRDDGLLVGYLETPDWAAAQQGMARTEVSPRWSTEMDELVVPGTTMAYPRLTLHLLPGSRAQHRHCIVLRDPLPLEVRQLEESGVGNLCVFERADGLTVVYGETGGPGIPDASPLATLAATTEPLREVFNLAERLQAHAR